MKTIKYFFLVAAFALWGCQEEQFSREENQLDSSRPHPRVERLRTIKRVDNAPPTRAVGVKDKLWQPGDTIRIKFQNAVEYPGMSEKVIQYAAIWLQYANLHFEYVEPFEEADVKIGFNTDTRKLSWSTIGTDCKQIPQDEVSLHFIDLNKEEDEEIIQGEILRGFGHVLGLGFEHRSPDSPVNLNDAKTIDYYMDNYDLTEEDIINDILPYYNEEQTNYTEFDDESIMCLEFPKRSTQNTPSYPLDFNYTLSATDTAFVRNVLYPPFEPIDSNIVTIKVQAPDVSLIFSLKSEINIDWGNGKKTTLRPDDYDGASVGESMNYSFDDINTIKIYGADSAVVELAIYVFYGSSVLELDVSKNKHLESLGCMECNLPSLDVSKNAKLKILNCSKNNLNNLNTTNNKELDVLQCNDNNISYLNLHNNNKLHYIDACNNKLNSLDVKQIAELYDLYIDNNSINSIDVSKNQNLKYLYVTSNQISTLDVSSNLQLISLKFDDNKISNIDVSNNSELWTLHCNNNNLSSLNIRGLKQLVELEFIGNPISYEETRNIFKSINDRNETSNGRIRFPSYCYRDRIESCEDYHATCYMKEIKAELANLFKTKNWTLVSSNGWAEPYSISNFSKQNHSKYSNYFQQLFEKVFGFNPYQQ